VKLHDEKSTFGPGREGQFFYPSAKSNKDQLRWKKGEKGEGGKHRVLVVAQGGDASYQKGLGQIRGAKRILLCPNHEPV